MTMTLYVFLSVILVCIAGLVCNEKEWTVTGYRKRGWIKRAAFLYEQKGIDAQHSAELADLIADEQAGEYGPDPLEWVTADEAVSDDTSNWDEE